MHDINPGKIEIWRQQHHFLKGLVCYCSIWEMRILFGMILLNQSRRHINENTVWTDSQDYGADEILYTT